MIKYSEPNVHKFHRFGSKYNNNPGPKLPLPAWFWPGINTTVIYGIFDETANATKFFLRVACRKRCCDEKMLTVILTL
jgi:hypothetical protein